MKTSEQPKRLSQAARAKHVYKRALERGHIYAPKLSTLVQYGLLDWWEGHKTTNFEHLVIYDREKFRLAALRTERQRSESASSN